MLSCKEVSVLVSESLDRKLAFRQRLAVRMHLLMCRFCSRYRKQLLFLKDAAGAYARIGEDVLGRVSGTLPPEARQRILEALQDQVQDAP